MRSQQCLLKYQLFVLQDRKLLFLLLIAACYYSFPALHDLLFPSLRAASHPTADPHPGNAASEPAGCSGEPERAAGQLE